MSIRTATVALIVWASLAGLASAQIPGIPAAPAAPAAPPVPGAPGVPGGAGSAASSAMPSSATSALGNQQPQNIWSKICLTDDQRAKCRKRICECSLFQMFGAMLKPAMMMSGGLIKPICPGPNDATPEDLAKSADSPDGAAARIKKDEAEAAKRRANVRYLGTVDCSRWPEAEKALISALRTDKNECVRWEAAIVLGHGCCCTRKTIEALRLTAIASDKDGNPKESSERVRCAAQVSLASCESRTSFPPVPPEKLPPIPAPSTAMDRRETFEPALARASYLIPPPPPVTSTPKQQQAQPVPAQPAPAPLPPAPVAMQITPAMPAPLPTSAMASTEGPPTGQRGLFDIFRRNFTNEPQPLAGVPR
jgi:hypothetical protein